MNLIFNQTGRLLLLLTMFFLAAAGEVNGQYKIKGTVYDSSNNYVIQFVTVQSSSGKGTMTDANGYYEIEVAEKDSIWFSYLNKPTVKFPVLKIANPHNLIAGGFIVHFQ